MAPGITMMDYGRPGTYVPFKNGTIVNIFIIFIINIIVNTLFLYNIIRMPYFVARDEHWQHFSRDLLFVMLFTCKISAMQYELALYQ